MSEYHEITQEELKQCFDELLSSLDEELDVQHKPEPSKEEKEKRKSIWDKISD